MHHGGPVSVLPGHVRECLYLSEDCKVRLLEDNQCYWYCGSKLNHSANGHDLTQLVQTLDGLVRVQLFSSSPAASTQTNRLRATHQLPPVCNYSCGIMVHNNIHFQLPAGKGPAGLADRVQRTNLSSPTSPPPTTRLDLLIERLKTLQFSLFGQPKRIRF